MSNKIQIRCFSNSSKVWHDFGGHSHSIPMPVPLDRSTVISWLALLVPVIPCPYILPSSLPILYQSEAGLSDVMADLTPILFRIFMQLVVVIDSFFFSKYHHKISATSLYGKVWKFWRKNWEPPGKSPWWQFSFPLKFSRQLITLPSRRTSRQSYLVMRIFLYLVFSFSKEGKVCLCFLSLYVCQLQCGYLCTDKITGSEQLAYISLELVCLLLPLSSNKVTLYASLWHFSGF